MTLSLTNLQSVPETYRLSFRDYLFHVERADTRYALIGPERLVQSADENEAIDCKALWDDKQIQADFSRYWGQDLFDQLDETPPMEVDEKTEMALYGPPEDENS